jgi:hypothetical protein
MALLKSFNEIEEFIPTPYEQVYMHKMVRINKTKLEKKPIYAFIVDPNLKMIVNSFQLVFVLFSCDVNHYLFLNDFNKELSSSTPYFTAKTKETMPVKKTDWNFKTDKLGLYGVTGSRVHNTVYFGTSPNDVNDIIKALEIKSVTKKTVIASPVYI